MTAREKFIARLKELGLDGVWPTEDHVGKVMDDGSIVVLIHVETDPHEVRVMLSITSHKGKRIRTMQIN